MKKFFIILVALLAIPAMIFANAATEQQTEEIVLDFPTWQADEAGFRDFWKVVIDEFEAKHPNVKINIYQVPFAQFTDTLITRYSAGNAPDITHLATRFFNQFSSQGWLENLDPYFEKYGTINGWTALEDAMLEGGEHQGLVLMGYPFVLYYNEAILKQAGVSVPTTVEELKAAIDKINKLNNPDLSAFGTTTIQHSNAYNDFTNFIYGAGATVVENGKFYLNTPEVIAAVKDYNYCASNSPKGVATEMMRQLFIDGKVAMLLDGPFIVPLFEKADADIRPNLKIARPPFKKIPGTISNSLHMAKDLPENRKALVFDFIQTCATAENQLNYANFTKNPCGLTTVAEKLTDPNLQFIYAMGNEAVNTLPASKNLSSNYSKYINLTVGYILQLQEKSADVAGILKKLEADLRANSLEP